MKLRKGSKNHSFGNTRDALYCLLVISTAFLLFISENVWLAVRAGYQLSHSLAVFPPRPLRNSSISFLLICVSATHQCQKSQPFGIPKTHQDLYALWVSLHKPLFSPTIPAHSVHSRAVLACPSFLPSSPRIRILTIVRGRCRWFSTPFPIFCGQIHVGWPEFGYERPSEVLVLLCPVAKSDELSLFLLGDRKESVSCCLQRQRWTRMWVWCSVRCFLLQASHEKGAKPMASAQVRGCERYRYTALLFSYVFEMLTVLWEVYDREVGECCSRKSIDPSSGRHAFCESGRIYTIDNRKPREEL